jgi:hypothetical protein
MRAAIIALMLMIGSQAGAESEVSGMLACNPNKTGAKPVIYAFDGKYLLRDNQKKTPFQHIASIAGFLEIYFAFVPTVTMRRQQRDFENAVKQFKQDIENTGKTLNGPKASKYIKEFDNFQEWCSRNTVNGGSFRRYAVNIIDNPYVTYFEQNFLDVAAGTQVKLTCENTKGKTVHDFVHLKYRGVPPTNGPYENVDVNEFNQFKVTVDLNKMTVRQEIYAPLGKIGQKNRSFDAEEFRCQSLGIDVPEIDVSESITPIGKGI